MHQQPNVKLINDKDSFITDGKQLIDKFIDQFSNIGDGDEYDDYDKCN